MKVLVCGSREWLYPSRVHARIDALGAAHGRLTVIHGGAAGADTHAAAAAAALGHDVLAFPADWQRHGKAAGPIRNRQMLDQRPDLVVAFVRHGASGRGTQDTIAEAQRRGIPVEIESDQHDHRRAGASWDTIYR